VSEQLVMDATWADRGFDETKARRSPFPWTPENVEQLRRLTDDGLSASKIGAKLGTSRNSVIAKQHRIGIRSKIRPTCLGIRSPHKPKKPRIQLYPGRTRNPYTRKAPTILEQPILDCVPLNLTFDELKPGQCKYPYGDTPNMLFCGLPAAMEGCSWCAAHYRVVFTGPSQKPQSTWRDQVRTPAARFA